MEGSQLSELKRPNLSPGGRFQRVSLGPRISLDISLLISFSANRLVCRRGAWLWSGLEWNLKVQVCFVQRSCSNVMLWNARHYSATAWAAYLKAFHKVDLNIGKIGGVLGLSATVVHSLSPNLLRNAKKCRHIFHSFNLHTDAKSRAAHIFGCFRPFLEFV